MTSEKIRRIQEAIADCNAYIAFEGARADDLRTEDRQNLLDFYVSHRDMLSNMLEAEYASQQDEGE